MTANQESHVRSSCKNVGLLRWYEKVPACAEGGFSLVFRINRVVSERLELLREQEVPGSSPGTPTILPANIQHKKPRGHAARMPHARASSHGFW